MKTIYLFSTSELKRRALENRGFTDIKVVPPAPTPLEQPIGQAQALECLRARMAHSEELLASMDDESMAVAIENYIERENDAFFDRVAIYCVLRSGLMPILTFGSHSVRVPDSEQHLLSELILTGKTRHTTFGQVFAQKRKLDAKYAKDWFEAADVSNPSRVQQIELTVFDAQEAVRNQTDTRDSIRVYPNWPKDGVQFLDIFSLMSHRAGPQVYSESMAKAFDSMMSIDRALKEKAVVFGLESRGLMLGAMLAEKCKLGFVPVRKEGKLPGKVFSCTYNKEYGQDTFELAEAHLPKDQSTLCVIADDLIATGGSICATISLLKELGYTNFAVISLIDVPALRTQWRAALKSVAPNAIVRLAL